MIKVTTKVIIRVIIRVICGYLLMEQNNIVGPFMEFFKATCVKWLYLCGKLSLKDSLYSLHAQRWPAGLLRASNLSQESEPH